MAFLKNFTCRGCGSSLGKSRVLPNGLRTTWCFTCCAGDFKLLDHEIEGLDTEQMAGLAGREWGTCKTIHRRINTPGEKQAFRPSADHVKWQLYERNNNNVLASQIHRDTGRAPEQGADNRGLSQSENKGSN